MVLPLGEFYYENRIQTPHQNNWLSFLSMHSTDRVFLFCSIKSVFRPPCITRPETTMFIIIGHYTLVQGLKYKALHSVVILLCLTRNIVWNCSVTSPARSSFQPYCRVWYLSKAAVYMSSTPLIFPCPVSLVWSTLVNKQQPRDTIPPLPPFVRYRWSNLHVIQALLGANSWIAAAILKVCLRSFRAWNWAFLSRLFFYLNKHSTRRRVDVCSRWRVAITHSYGLACRSYCNFFIYKEYFFI